MDLKWFDQRMQVYANIHYYDEINLQFFKSLGQKYCLYHGNLKQNDKMQSCISFSVFKVLINWDIPYPLRRTIPPSASNDSVSSCDIALLLVRVT